MKRTTYIMIGMLLAGLVIISVSMFYTATHGTRWEDKFMEIKGTQKTVQLPSCKVVKLVQPMEWKQKKEGIVETERYVAFSDVPLKITPADTLQGSFSFAGDMESFMTMTSVGDTLLISFQFPNDKLEKRFHNDRLLRLRSTEMALNLPASVQTVRVDLIDMETTFYDFRCDTLSFQVRGLAKVENCHIASLAAQAHILHLNSGEVDNLYLNLDQTSNWNVEPDSFHLNTEHLSGSSKHHCTLVKGECQRVLWTPQTEGATLNVELMQAATIEVNE